MSFTLFVTFSLAYRIMIAIIILLITFRIQINLNPYKNDDYNSIEILALLTGTVTIFSGLIFTMDDEDQESFWNAIIMMFVIVFNIVFVLRWTYLFMKTMSGKYKIFKQIVTVIQYLFCIKSSKVQENIHQNDKESLKNNQNAKLEGKEKLKRPKKSHRKKLK